MLAGIPNTSMSGTCFRKVQRINDLGIFPLWLQPWLSTPPVCSRESISPLEGRVGEATVGWGRGESAYSNLWVWDPNLEDNQGQFNVKHHFWILVQKRFYLRASTCHLYKGHLKAIAPLQSTDTCHLTIYFRCKNIQGEQQWILHEDEVETLRRQV